MLAITKFENYLIQLEKPFQIVTDAQALVFLTTKKLTSARLMRYAIRLQEFRFTIKYRQGRLNKDADALSRLPVEDGPRPIIDEEDVVDLEDNRENREFYQFPGEDIAEPRPPRRIEEIFPVEHLKGTVSDADLASACHPSPGDEGEVFLTTSHPTSYTRTANCLQAILQVICREMWERPATEPIWKGSELAKELKQRWSHLPFRVVTSCENDYPCRGECLMSTRSFNQICNDFREEKITRPKPLLTLLGRAIDVLSDQSGQINPVSTDRLCTRRSLRMTRPTEETPYERATRLTLRAITQTICMLLHKWDVQQVSRDALENEFIRRWEKFGKRAAEQSRPRRCRGECLLTEGAFKRLCEEVHETGLPNAQSRLPEIYTQAINSVTNHLGIVQRCSTNSPCKDEPNHRPNERKH